MRTLTLSLALALAACGPAAGTDEDTDDTEDTEDTDVEDTDVEDTDVEDTDDTVDTDDTDVATSCKDAGGICTGVACAAGTELAAFAADCVFDDGPGRCCEAPPFQPTGDTCPDRGGVCAPVGGCLEVDGYLAPTDDCSDAFGPSYTCCVPEAQCGLAELECCTESTIFFSTCDRGEETCDHIEGTTANPIGTCMVP